MRAIACGVTLVAFAILTDANLSSAGNEQPPTTGNKPTPVPATSGTAEGKGENDLVWTTKTVASRADLSAFLVADAEKAAKGRRWVAAIPYYQALLAARGPASPEATKLATLWALAGQSEDSAAVWSQIAAATTDQKQKTEALAEVARLTANPDPFADRIELTPLAAPARKAFAAGRKAFAKKQYGDALVLFHVGYALAPDLPGFLRELGATYDKLGARDKKLEFYRRYLLARPFGGNADLIRKELGNDKSALGTLVVQTSMPCEQLWINRQRVSSKLPANGLSVAPGTYKGLCFASKYEMALFEYAVVEAGKPARLDFAWAIIDNQLTNPYGRISIENPKTPGIMIDLGISSQLVGVAVPADRRALKMVLKDDLGTKTVERTVSLQPGQRTVVKW